MELVKHETCLEYLQRRMSEGWKLIDLEGYRAVLLSPDGNIRRELDLRNDIEILRPNANTAENEWDGGHASHYTYVDEAVADGDTSYNQNTTAHGVELVDLFGLPDPSPSGTINSVTVFINAKKQAGASGYSTCIKTEGTKYFGAWCHDTVYTERSTVYATNPNTSLAWTWTQVNALEAGIRGYGNSTWYQRCTQVYVEVDYVGIVAPTVTTQAATSVEDTTATGNGNITDTGGENCDIRGIVWDLASHGDPGDTAPGASDYANDVAETNSFGTGAFTRSLTSLPTGDTIYARAYAHNSEGYSYGDEVSFLTKPAAPTSVAATDGVHTDKVVITWTKSTGATGYQVYRNGTPLGWLGDVATHNDTGAGAPTITPGAAAASDGTSFLHVSLSLSGQSANNGATHTYKVRAKNTTGESADSGTNTGYRGVGSLTYQWQRSAADSDANYSNIDGATTASYDDTGAPENGDGRYYRCVENATGATQQISAVDRGYRNTPFYQNVGQGSLATAGVIARKTSSARFGLGSIAIAGVLIKKTSIDVGFNAVGIAGSLVKKTLTGVGSGAVASAGALSTIWTQVIGVGSGAVSSAGTLIRKTSTSIGDGAISIAGIVVKKTSASFGQGSVAIAGALIAARYHLKAVGSGVVSSAGALTRIVVSQFQAVGDGAITIVGSLTTVATHFKTVGDGAVAMSGNAAKKMYQTCGGALLDIRGYITQRNIYKAVGSGAIALAGSLDTVKMKLQAVGGGAVSIAGALTKLPKKVVGGGAIAISGAVSKFPKKLVGYGTVAIAGSIVKTISKSVGNAAVSIWGKANAFVAGVPYTLYLSFDTGMDFELSFDSGDTRVGYESWELDLDFIGGGDYD